MKKRDILFIFCGIILTILSFMIFSLLRPDFFHYHSDKIRLVDLNDEISKQRANAIVLAAQKVGQAVVSITVVQTEVVSTSPFYSPFDDEIFRDFFRNFFPEYYYEKQIKNFGSGVIISSDGYILTNEHVISNATNIKVTLPDGRQFNSEIVASDRVNDIALIKVNAIDLPYAELGDSQDMMIGEWVIALGNPFGFLLEDTRPTVTVGVVSALNRAIKSTREDRVYKNMIQTDAAINPGNSGGPLVNILGQVVGINTAIFTSGGGSEGIGFARPINDVKRFINETKKYGEVRTPWIGLWLQDITEKIVKAKGLEGFGALVRDVDKGSSADDAGIKEEDLIILVNSNAINSVSDWDRFISNVFVDDTMHMTLLRGKDSIKTILVVKEFKKSTTIEKRVVIYGIYVENINSILRERYNLGYKEGIVVVKVESNSIGKKLGIMPGDVVLKIGDMRIRNKDDFQRAFQITRDINFIIDRGGLIVQLYLGT